MKTILPLLLLVVSLSVFAKPEFQPLPGTPEAATATNTSPEAAKLQDELNKLEAATSDAAATVTAAEKAMTNEPPVTTSKAAQTVVSAKAPAVLEVVPEKTVVPAPPAPAAVSAPAPAPVKTAVKAETTKPAAKPAVTKAAKTSKAKKTSGDDGVIELKPTTPGSLPKSAAVPAAAVAAPTPVDSFSGGNATESAVAPVTAYRMTNELKTSTADAAALTPSAPPATPSPAPAPAPVAPVAPPPAVVVKPAAASPASVAPPTAPVPAPTPFATIKPAPTPATPAPAVAAVPPAPVAAPIARPVPTPTVAAKPAAAKEMIPAGGVRFQAAPLEQVLDYYSDLVHRTLLRPAQLPAASITINTKNDLTAEEAVQALDSVLGLNGIAMIPVGEKFMKVVPQAQANQEGAALSTITNAADLPEIGQYITYVVQLKYAKPSEVATSLTPFAKVPNSVMPLDSNGILIIRDFTENVKRMLEMIERIDVAIPSEFVSEVIPIKYALAADIQSALSSISGGGSGTSVGATRNTGATAGASRLAGAGTTAYPGNTSGGLNRMPGSAGTPGSPVSSGLGGGGAAGASASFSDRLRNIIQKASASGDIQLIGPNKIIADERTNSLLVFATREDMNTIKDIIGKLDVVLAQVLIEAVIMDVTLGNDFNFGISAGQRPRSIGGTNGSAIGGNIGGQLQGALSFLNNLVQDTNGNFNAATIVPYGSDSGLSYFGRLNQSWDFAIKAIAGDNNIKVLARPRIQTSHAVPASIFVGETRPYITGTYYDGYSGGNSRSQYSQTQIGISLNVLPLINPEGLVVMDIQQQVQQVGGSVKIDNNDVPITQDQNSQTKVAVYDGQTVVLGGFIRDQKSETKSGVPYLKDIPLLGGLFRSTSTTGGRRELLVLIRPTVLPTPQIAAMQSEVERNRLTAVREAEAEFTKEQLLRMKKASKKTKTDLKEEYRQAEAMEKAAQKAEKK